LDVTEDCIPVKPELKSEEAKERLETSASSAVDLNPIV
jgi:hypothetical protein